MPVDKANYYAFFFPTILAIWFTYFLINARKKRKVPKFESYLCLIIAALIGPVLFLITNEALHANWVEDPIYFLRGHFLWHLPLLAIIFALWRKECLSKETS